jgi:hypothetical protein
VAPAAEAVPRALVADPCLDCGQVSELGRLLRRTEDVLGMPVEIEWALDERGFTLLQARPLRVRPAHVPDTIWLQHPRLNRHPAGVGWGVQGTSAAGALATLYFDVDSALLVRLVRYTDSPVGRIPTQIDFAEYRDVAGVKMPFRWTVSWVSGREVVELSEIQANVPIDAARFARPLPPGAPQ